jgi:superfamily II DNA/RNA helicase
MGAARTGSGKTLAFLIPAINKTDSNDITEILLKVALNTIT